MGMERVSTLAPRSNITVTLTGRRADKVGMASLHNHAHGAD